MKEVMNWVTEEESGQGMVEYLVVVGLVAIAAMVGFKMIGTQLNVKAIALGEKIAGLWK